MSIKDRIKELRTEKNFSQMQLAKATGLSQGSIARWELGKTEPTAAQIVKLADFFNVTADYLLGREDYFN